MKPMWIFVFGFLGLGIAFQTRIDEWLLLAFVGLIPGLLSKSPSEVIGFNKSPFEAIIVWIVIIAAYFLLVTAYLEIPIYIGV
jgi:hypothetical protein